MIQEKSIEVMNDGCGGVHIAGEFEIVHHVVSRPVVHISFISRVKHHQRVRNRAPGFSGLENIICVAENSPTQSIIDINARLRWGIFGYTNYILEAGKTWG